MKQYVEVLMRGEAPGSAGFQPASLPADLYLLAGKMPALPVVAILMSGRLNQSK